MPFLPPKKNTKIAGKPINVNTADIYYIITPKNLLSTYHIRIITADRAILTAKYFAFIPGIALLFTNISAEPRKQD